MRLLKSVPLWRCYILYMAISKVLFKKGFEHYNDLTHQMLNS